ncbi:ATP-binding protein [Aquimarina sp. 2201CG5-10]|uniref:tetratricopeptide repeat-containing sensor histidine kinase n=1 Tax=Aquimarina callyspongiae TaxID=3098150 RepID=UPI002AB3C53B|nr:ATP-binding protein [Aquimarina sp. 2201CG5-10]MDY8134660.1 hypothetical protein [Aquimarina sp. 2201CG5-10]
MKRFTVPSLFFLCISLGILFNSCNRAIKNDQISSQITKKIDSLNNYYSIADDNSGTKEKRLEALDNFLQGANALQIDSLQCKGVYLKGKLFNKYKGPQKAIEQSDLLLQLAKKSNDSVYMGRAFYRLGYYNRKLDNYLDAFGYYNQSFKIRRNIKDSINSGKCLMAMSNIQRKLGDHNATKITATDGITYLENSTEYRTLAGLYHNISISFKEQGNYKEALVWNDKILYLVKDSIANKQIRKLDKANFKITRANILVGQKKYDESIFILEELLNQKHINSNSATHTLVLSNLGYIKFQKDSLNPESESLLLKALEIRKQKGTTSGLVASNLHLSKYYRDKNLVKSLHYAREAHKNAIISKNQESIFETLDLITNLNSGSLEDHQRFKETSLNLMELRRKTREIYAPTRFENENLLKDNEEKNRKISQVRNQNTIYLLGMLLLLTGIGFVGYFFRQRTRYLSQQNKIVQFQASYETETRISKRLHDELGNDIFQVMMQYQNNPHDPQIPDKLNNTYIKARDISRENSEFETGVTYPEELNNMLQNYTQNNIQLIMRGFDKIDWSDIDKTVKITVYRVLQELMTNMQKHSKANLVALIFSQVDNNLGIKYSDNGVGMEEEHTKSKNGLRNTEKRIQAINGSLTFVSEKDKGLKAEIQIPS